MLTVEEPPEPVSESRPPVLNAGGADEEASVHSVHSSAVQEPLDEQFMVRHRMSDVGVMEQQGYGSLRRLQQATPPCHVYRAWSSADRSAWSSADEQSCLTARAEGPAMRRSTRR